MRTNTNRNAYQNYLEQEILTADPIRLVQLMYHGALDAIREARRYLGTGDIHSRTRCINKAFNILTELTRSLDHAHGGEVSQNLARLYDYLQRLILDANSRQVDAPLAEAEKLFSTLLEAWDQAQPVRAPEPHYTPEASSERKSRWHDESHDGYHDEYRCESVSCAY